MGWREDAFAYLCQYNKKDLSEIIQENMPEFLYRYRGSGNYDISALENNELWISSIDGLNDQDEFTLNFDDKRLIKCELNASHEIIDLIKNTTLVSCFTENIDDSYFWTKYADDYQGFCVEYKTADILNYIESTKGMFFGPVKYGDKMVINDFSNECHKFAFTVFEKKDEWSNENEWRILYNKVDSSNKATWNKTGGRLMKFVTPNKVIFGKSMSNKKIEKIKKICVNNGFKICIQV